MNISKADAVAHLAKWYDAKIEVRAVYTSITGKVVVIGRLKELSASGVTVAGTGCEMSLFFRNTSHYDFKDTREPTTETNRDRLNKYPTFINVKFSNSDHVEISEFFKDVPTTEVVGVQL